MFETGNQFDAVMCANDEVAFGVYRAADACGTRVPDDVAVTGDRQPMRELGARAAALLFARIDGRPAASSVLRTSVVIRESCGCRSASGRSE